MLCNYYSIGIVIRPLSLTVPHFSSLCWNFRFGHVYLHFLAFHTPTIAQQSCYGTITVFIFRVEEPLSSLFFRSFAIMQVCCALFHALPHGLCHIWRQENVLFVYMYHDFPSPSPFYVQRSVCYILQHLPTSMSTASTHTNVHSWGHINAHSWGHINAYSKYAHQCPQNVPTSMSTVEAAWATRSMGKGE